MKPIKVRKKLTFIISLEFAIFQRNKNFDIEKFQNIVTEATQDCKIDTMQEKDVTPELLQQYKKTLHNKLKVAFS